jgi:hypothetical protein
MLACISPQPLHHRFETAEIDLAYDQLLIISILLLLVIAIVAVFGLLVMSLEANSALGQWVLPSELEHAYKQGYLKSNVTIDEQEIDQK